MRRIAALAFVTSFGAAACSDPPAPTELELPRSFNANPASNGAIVVSFDGAFQLALFDAEKQLLAFHNFRNAFPACGQPVTQIRLAEFREVHSGADPTLINRMFQAPETFIWVWHSTDGSVLNARCRAPIATGVGQLVQTDNDLTPFLGDRARANSFGFTATGSLTGSDGKTYHYSGRSRIVFRAETGSLLNEVASITLGATGQ